MQLFQLEERLLGVATWADAQPWPAVFRPVDTSGGCPQDDQDIDQETGEHYPRYGYPARSMSLGPPRSFPDTPIKRPRPPPPPPQHRIEQSVPPRASTWCCFPQKKPPPMLRAQGPPRLHHKARPKNGPEQAPPQRHRPCLKLSSFGRRLYLDQSTAVRTGFMCATCIGLVFNIGLCPIEHGAVPTQSEWPDSSWQLVGHASALKMPPLYTDMPCGGVP